MMSSIRFLPVLLFVASSAAAQSYPAKPVRVIVPFPPSGGTDVIMRVLQPELSEALGQQVVIDNRAGANGNIGTELAASATPDGYTLLFNGSGTLAINPALYSKLPFDVLKDFAPITLTVLQPNVVGVHPAIPAHSIKELIALARAQPGKFNYGSSGNGSLSHLAGEIFQAQAKIKLVHVPYKGAAPALADLVAGQVQLVFAGAPSVMSHVKADRLRVLSVTTSKRVAALPDLPTVAESGLPGFQVVGWYGVLAPKDTPAAIVSRLNADMLSTLRQPGVRRKLADLGLEVETTTPRSFGDFMKAEIEKYASVVKAAKIRVD